MTSSNTSYLVPASRVSGTVCINGSKSLAHRYIILACLLNKRVELHNVPESEDVLSTVNAVAAMGYTVHQNWKSHELVVRGNERAPIRAATVFVGESGTTARLICALCASVPGEWKLTGAGRLPQRPMQPLFHALNSMGCRVQSQPSHPVQSDVLAIIHSPQSLSVDDIIEIDVTQSSQFHSALLLLAATEPALRIVPNGAAASKPYTQLTHTVLAHFGFRIEQSSNVQCVKRDCNSRASSVYIEPDFSSVAYWLCAAALTQGTVSIPNITVESVQADSAVLNILKPFVTVQHRDGVLVCSGNGITHGIHADCTNFPDLVPTLAVIAVFAQGSSTFMGVEHLQHKESNRIQAIRDMVHVLGGCSDFDGNVLTIEPVQDRTDRRADVATYGDHRIAMAAAVAGLHRGNVYVQQPQCVQKSYPEFWDHLEQLTSTG